MRPSESGNILWFILVAVAMLAALTLVLSRGGSTVDQSGDIEQLRIRSGQLLNYTKSIQTAVQDMKLRGCSENEISFWHDSNDDNTEDSSDTYYNSRSPTDRRCHLFDVEGAGLSYREFERVNDGSAWIFTAANNVGTTAGPVGTTADGSGNDIIMLLPNAEEDLCIQINRQLSVGTAGTLPVDDEIATTEFTGTFPTGSLTILEGDTTTQELNRTEAGCFIDDNDSDKIYFYYVVLAR